MSPSLRPDGRSSKGVWKTGSDTGRTAHFRAVCAQRGALKPDVRPWRRHNMIGWPIWPAIDLARPCECHATTTHVFLFCLFYMSFYHVLCVFCCRFRCARNTAICDHDHAMHAPARAKKGSTFLGGRLAPSYFNPHLAGPSRRGPCPLLKPWRARAEPRARRSLIAPPTSSSARRSCRRAQIAPFPRRNNRVVTEVWQVQRCITGDHQTAHHKLGAPASSCVCTHDDDGELNTNPPTPCQ